MKFGDFRVVPLATITRPADFDARRASPHVAELAKSIAALGGQPLHPLLVAPGQGGRWDVIAGRDRLTACDLASLTHVPIRIVGGATPLELRRLELAENIFRRTLDPAERQRQLAEYVRERAAEIQQQWDMGRVVNGKLIPHPGGPRLITPAAPLAAHPAERQREPGDDDDEDAPPRFAGAVPSNTCYPADSRPVPPDTGSAVVSPKRTSTSFAPTARGEAIREVAAASGRSVAAVKMELSRHEAKVAAPSKPVPVVDDAHRTLDALRKAAKLAAQHASELAAMFPGRLDVKDLADVAHAALRLAEDFRLPKAPAEDAADVTPAPPPGRFDNDPADGLEPFEVFAEESPGEVLP